MRDELDLPDTALTRAALDHAERVLPAYLFNHSVRTFLYARELGRETDVDLEVLFLGCVLHDLGLTGPTGQRFEVEGADAARRFLVERKLNGDAADVVWQAIALHTSVGIADRMRPEIALVQAGSGADVLGRGLDDVRAWAEGLLPRLDLTAAITSAIVERATIDPRSAPPLSFPALVAAEWPGGPDVPGWRALSGLDNRAKLV